MLLLRQVGGAGLWLMLSHTAAQQQRRLGGRGGSSTGVAVGGSGSSSSTDDAALASPAVIEELRKVRLVWCDGVGVVLGLC